MRPMWPVKERVQWARNRHLKSHDDLGLATTPPPTNKKNRYNTLMSGLRCLHRYSLALTLLAGLALMAAGCRMATPAPVRENVHAADDLAANEQQIRLRIRALVEPYSGSIVETADRIRAGTTNRAIRREALLWKIEAVPALREALFRPNPLVAIGDTWVLIWQMTDYFEKGRGKLALGAASPIAAATCRYLEGELAGVAASITRSGDVSNVRNFTMQWAAEHPIRHSIAARESTLSRALEREIQETFTAQEMVINIAAKLDDLSHRIDIFSAQLFDQSRWQAELFAMDLAEDYQMERALPLAENAVQSGADAIKALNRIIPPLEAALETVNAAPATFAEERKTAIEILQQELTRTIQFAQMERIAALEHLTKERVAALTALHDYIREERRALMGEMKELCQEVVDHVLVRTAQMVAAILAASFVGVVVLLFITRQVFRTPTETLNK
jgi:hypothetical protein